MVSPFITLVIFFLIVKKLVTIRLYPLISNAGAQRWSSFSLCYYSHSLTAIFNEIIPAASSVQSSGRSSENPPPINRPGNNRYQEVGCKKKFYNIWNKLTSLKSMSTLSLLKEGETSWDDIDFARRGSKVSSNKCGRFINALNNVWFFFFAFISHVSQGVKDNILAFVPCF